MVPVEGGVKALVPPGKQAQLPLQAIALGRELAGQVLVVRSARGKRPRSPGISTLFQEVSTERGLRMMAKAGTRRVRAGRWAVKRPGVLITSEKSWVSSLSMVISPCRPSAGAFRFRTSYRQSGCS
jgi:hypothetical protein